MSIRKPFHRGALAGALALLLAGAAFAGESLSDVTRVQVRTEAGNIEVVSVADLKVGEVRAVVTEAGNPAVISLDDKGLKLEVANEIFEANVPAGHKLDELLADAELGDGHTRIVQREIARDESSESREKRIVIVKREHGAHGDAGHDAEHMAHALAHADHHAFAEPSLADPALAGKRILVTRRIEKQSEVASQ